MGYTHTTPTGHSATSYLSNLLSKKNMPLRQSRLLNFQEPRASYNQGKELSLASFRKKVIGRDNNQCKHCNNAIQDPYRKRKPSFQAHHIIARSHGGKNTLNNGITLCMFCHHYFDLMYQRFGLDYFQVISQRMIEKRFNEIRTLQKRRYHNHLLNIIRGE